MAQTFASIALIIPRPFQAFNPSQIDPQFRRANTQTLSLLELLLPGYARATTYITYLHRSEGGSDESFPKTQRLAFEVYLHRHKISIDNATVSRFRDRRRSCFTVIPMNGLHVAKYEDIDYIPILVENARGYPRSRSFGSVTKVRGHNSRGESIELARKTLLRRFDDDEFQRRFLRERQVMLAIDNAHILKLFGSYAYRGTYHVLISPFAEHTLAAILNARDKLSLLIVCEPCMSYLHAAGVVHRDIKADNILVKNGRVFWGDLYVRSGRTGPPAYRSQPL
jgi:hypothetical protein